MKAGELVRVLNPNIKIDAKFDFSIKGISVDSRWIGRDYCFIAVKGTALDGHKYIKTAIEKGARLIVHDKSYKLDCNSFDKGGTVIFVPVDDSRAVVGLVSAVFYANPADKLRLTAVTGTNGKTTVAFLIEHLFSENNIPTGLIGTVCYKFAQNCLEAKHTTPDAVEIHGLFDKMLKVNVSDVVMEVSSHSLVQERVQGLNFQVAVFTNLTHDHLDYHQNKEQYFFAKAKLFQNLAEKSYAVINSDDEYGKRLKSMTSANVIDYAIKDKNASVFAENIVLGMHKTCFTAVTSQGRFSVQTKLIGRHNIYNILACICVGIIRGLAPQAIAAAIETMGYVPGRLENFKSEKGFEVFVDYAHTDDALNNVLDALRELKPKRIITVFGCGGDRDRAKRPLMGKIASIKSDIVVLTNDNPRSEDPYQIIESIKSGFTPEFKDYIVIPDRKEAITWAIAQAKKKDFVLIAGKGHETYQIFKDKTIDFDERKTVREILNNFKNTAIN
ncbi:MAG: UDP-N-acetylmuramoyl-L-alanyl-D-glutamate--2,6-diaminopimelate ligase [Candidatus Omnitrophica bacterium]|nr:UDP-N-acetylmuramoyl-L-alanyl-D-glutamate--2,6-diaminopimelate ligase [Candidatus Omnitrophota bacterium]